MCLLQEVCIVLQYRLETVGSNVTRLKAILGDKSHLIDVSDNQLSSTRRDYMIKTFSR